MILMEQKRVFTPAKAERCTHWSIGLRKTDLSSAGTLSRRRLFTPIILFDDFDRNNLYRLFVTVVFIAAAGFLFVNGFFTALTGRLT